MNNKIDLVIAETINKVLRAEHVHKADELTCMSNGYVDDVLSKLYKTAGTLLEEKYDDDAGARAFSLASKYYVDCGNFETARIAYMMAAMSWERISNRDAAALCIEKAIELAMRAGEYKIAANYHEQIARMFEKNYSELPMAIHHYSKAQNCLKNYDDDNNNIISTLKQNSEYARIIINLHIQLNQYNSAIKICVESIDNYREFGLGVLPLVLYAFLCQHNIDFSNLPVTMHIIDKYIKPDSVIRLSTEFKVIQLICHARNFEMFDAAHSNYPITVYMQPIINELSLKYANII